MALLPSPAAADTTDDLADDTTTETVKQYDIANFLKNFSVDENGKSKPRSKHKN